LASRDPAAAARIHPRDGQRIQRALELLATSGRRLDELWMQEDSYNGFGHWRICVLEPADRGRLHELIGQRLAAMLGGGFVDEVRRLMARDTLAENSPALRVVGYRQLAAHVQGREPLEAAAAKALAATRQLAKRQLTWLRGAKLLPAGATIVRADPFDGIAMERTLQVLIEAGAPP
jgi:tRNA dimethylallyltransferase